MTSHESQLKNSLFSREFLFFVEKTFDKISLIYIIKPSKFLKGENNGSICLFKYFWYNGCFVGRFRLFVRKTSGGRLKLALINTVISVMMLAVSLISFVYFNEKYFIQNKKEEEW